MGATWTSTDGRRGGFALLTVLLVLLALLVLSVPFLMTASNASSSSARFSDRVQGRLALDSALRQARSELARSHPGVDDTPYYDTLDEVTVRSELDGEFIDRLDTEGLMWEVVAEDLSGRIDLSSAGPQLVANVIDGATRVTAPVDPKAKSLPVSSTYGFPPTGFLWVGRELIGYTELTARSFDGLQRGLLASEDGEGLPLPCGPQPAGSIPIGTIVIDQRAFAPTLWRASVTTANTQPGEPQRFDAPEHLRASEVTALAPFDAADLDALARVTTPFGDVRGGRRWQRAARLTNDLQAGESCVLGLDQRRWFNPGTIVQLRAEGVVELGVVQSITAQNGIRLMDPVANDYLGYETEVRPLARRPVNANIADADTLRLLFQNVQQRGVNERVTRGEAEALAQLVVESRPFTGAEDFLRRVLLPASGMEPLPPNAPVVPAALADGGTLIDASDAVALYANAQNANDSRLLFSTLPLSFSSREVFALEARASLNAPSGIERTSAVREQTELIAPQQPLLQTWASQADFDEALRLDRESPWWASGPQSTSQFDGGSVPPSRLWTELGTWEGRVYLPGITPVPEDRDSEEPPTPEHTFPTRDSQGYAQLWPARVEESGRRAQRMLHFDHETRDPEGRFLPDGTVDTLTTSTRVNWSDATDRLLRALSFSMWIKPRDLAPGVLLDVGINDLERDRVTLAIEDEDLVLRVFDGPGDHPDTTEIEAGEVRFPLAAGDGPGLAADTWSHVEIDVAGNRPDQLTLLVDGQARGVRRPGLSALAADLGPSTRRIELEDGEGFPDRGVVRIGREFIEYVKTGPTTLDATHVPADGFGGRFARPPFVDDQPPVTTYTAEVQGQHAAGTPVELMGYSIPLQSKVQSTAAALAADLGIFAVARMGAVEGGPNKYGFGVTERRLGVALGPGLTSTSQLTGIELWPVDGDDTVITTETMMSAFSKSGGYAALIGWKPGSMTATDAFGGTTTVSPEYEGPNGEGIFGIEIIYYRGWNDTTLLVDPSGRAALAGTSPKGQPRAFVAHFAQGWNISSSSGLTNTRHGTFVVPISIPAPGLEPPNPNATVVRSEFAQLTHYDNDYAQTEWVRYDSIEAGHLVRNAPDALDDLMLVLTRSTTGTMDYIPPGGGGGGGGGGQQGGGGGVKPGTSPLPPLNPLTVVSASPGAPPIAQPAVAATPATQVTGAAELWQPYLGTHAAEYEQLTISRAANSVFQFRGVCGTAVGTHLTSTPVLPVWRLDAGLSIYLDDLPPGTPPPSSLAVWERDWDNGWPGRHDPIFIVDQDTTDPGFPATIHRVWQPLTHVEYQWQDNQTTGEPELVDPLGELVADDEVMIDPPYIHVALAEQFPVPVPATTISSQTPNAAADTRLVSRIVKFPSGERPREVQRAVIGGDLRSGDVPAAVIDEVIFQTPDFGVNSTFLWGAQAGQLLLTRGVFTSSSAVEVHPSRVRTAGGKVDLGPTMLDALPEDAGLLRLGEEIVCYSDVDSGSGQLTLAENGRGLLGTEEEVHEVGSTAQLLEGFVVSTLGAAIGAGDSALPLGDVADFPSQGTVMIGTELIHYTRIRGGALEMPRASSVAGEQDGRGDGIFRGRFGTRAVDHAFGEPVILFPFRYWDREATRADAPELSYLGLALDQPNAFARSIFWEADPTESSQLVVLQRASDTHSPAPPWDGEPDGIGLWSFERGMPGRDGNPVEAQADLFEWRIFVRYLPGAFDELDGLSHGWKRTPQLKLFGVDYIAPNQVLRRVDR